MTPDQRRLEEGRAHHAARRLAPAEAIYRDLLARVPTASSPTAAQALVLLGSLLLQTGRLPEATALFRDDVRRRPDDVDAHLALASLLQAQGALDEAVGVFERVVHLAPDHATACGQLGHLARARGDLDTALRWFERVVAIAPAADAARNDLARTLIDRGRPAEAEPLLRAALQSDPGRAELHHNLGIALAAMGRLDEASDAYRRAVAANPSFAAAYNNFGGTSKATMRLDQAAAAFEAALRLAPDAASAANAAGNLAGVLEWQARHDDALAGRRHALALAPADAGLHGSLLYSLLFHPAVDARALRAEHDAWNDRHARVAASVAYDVDRIADRRLRIGYVCGHFRDHVLGRYLMPLLRDHDRSVVEVFAYSNNRSDDASTEGFRRTVDAWRDIARLSDDEAAALIRRDRIDVLVDTTLHMDGNRLLVFARRPAPVQATFAGYPGSTGLGAIDHRLTDVHLDPPGLHDDRYVERSWRLPETFWCYDAAGAEVAPGPLPCDTRGHVTFGCMNNFAKTNDRMLTSWASVLKAVPDARLSLLSPHGSHRARTLTVFASLGIDATRIAFVDPRPRDAYLEAFHAIDISLDTVPYNGHTTSLDSLWMGVPVVTIVGETVVGRAGLSQLTNLGLTELIARTPEQYVTIAAALATDLPRLRRLRATLRERMVRSPLMDTVAFARNVEQAWRGMWLRWCDDEDARLSASGAARPRP